jgi:hypothetical protein
MSRYNLSFRDVPEGPVLYYTSIDIDVCPGFPYIYIACCYLVKVVCIVASTTSWKIDCTLLYMEVGRPLLSRLYPDLASAVSEARYIICHLTDTTQVPASGGITVR